MSSGSAASTDQLLADYLVIASFADALGSVAEQVTGVKDALTRSGSVDTGVSSVTADLSDFLADVNRKLSSLAAEWQSIQALCRQAISTLGATDGKLQADARHR